RIDRAGQLLAALSYHGVLARGFALVRDAEGRMVRTAIAVSPGMRLDIEFSDAHVRAIAEAGEGTVSSPDKPKKQRSGGGGQGSLFGLWPISRTGRTVAGGPTRPAKPPGNVGPRR